MMKPVRPAQATVMSASFLVTLQQQLREFARARDWEQFHTPKNLVMALGVEAAELQEVFQWLTAEQAAALTPVQRRQVEEEVADVLLYLCRLSDVLDIDMEQAALAKLARNAEKYPAEKVRGKAAKYSDY